MDLIKRLGQNPSLFIVCYISEFYIKVSCENKVQNKGLQPLVHGSILPLYYFSAIMVKNRIIAYYRHIFGDRLCYQQPVERIFVMKRKIGYFCNMVKANGQNR